jgi:hypothetical protein
MQHRLLFQDNSIKLEYNILSDCIIASWNGSQTELSIETGYTRILDAIKTHLCSGLLDNHSQISGLWAGAAEWLAQEWVPEARKAGLKHIAIVLSTHIFSRLSTEKAVKLINSPYCIGFDTLAAAEDWLGRVAKR